jgi:hypothetical protein
VLRAGAFVFDVSNEPPSSDSLLRAALARVPDADEDDVSPLLLRALIIGGAAIGAGTIAWLLSRPRSRDREPAERT